MSFIYQELAVNLREDINKGRLQAGQKLPSVRQFAQQHSVSLNTALGAYHLLESWGYLVTQAKSGFFVRQPTRTLPLPENKPFAATSKLVRNSDLIARVHSLALDSNRVALGTAQLDPELIPTKTLAKSLQRAINRAGSQPYLYCPTAGQPELIDAICQTESHSGLHLLPGEIIVSNGAMDAVSMALNSCTKPGDTILVPSPCHSGLLLLLANLQRKVIEIRATVSGFSIEEVESLLKSGKVDALLITAVHQNPLGFTLSVAQREQLVKLITRYQTPLVEDDVFGECSFYNDRPLPLKAFDQKGWVLYCNSFSKTLAAGYRIGWCAAGRFFPTLLQVRSATNLAINTPLQLALTDFVFSGFYRKHLKVLKPKIIQQMDQISQAVSKYFPQGTAISRPQGGYVLWVTLPQSSTQNKQGLTLFEAATKEGINIVPGVVFSASNRYQHCIRLNTGTRWDKSVNSAIRWLGLTVSSMG